MKNLDQIDPLPKFESVGTYTRPDGAQIWSKRQNEEWAKARQKQSGEDWQPYKRDGQIVPHTYINGQGKLKTEGYQPPEPPETDIPIPCVVDEPHTPHELFRLWRKSLRETAPEVPASVKMYLEYRRAEAEPQTQTASQTEQEPLHPHDIWDGWIPHKPGDPMPAGITERVLYDLRCNYNYGDDRIEEYKRQYAYNPDQWNYIVAWKPAT
jgi:hypothetical protein